MTKDQRDARRDYARDALRRADLQADPLAQFAAWLKQATDAELIDATAMTLATADNTGRPSARIVLLKHYDARGYVWYTAYDSPKGNDLSANPEASLLFYWREFERQVRITGTVEKVAREESENYFLSRPLESRFTAAASRQSAPVENREILETKVAELQARYPDGRVPVPEHWGGYRLQAREYEFWQGRTGRLHDRFVYKQKPTGWHIDRLQP